MRTSLLLAAGLLGHCGGRAPAQDLGTLSEPGNYGFAPPAYRQGGVAEISVGSHAMRSGSLRMDSGLIGNSGTRAFVALGEEHGPDLPRGQDRSRLAARSQRAALGLEKSFADGTTVSLEGGWQNDRLTAGHPRQAR